MDPRATHLSFEQVKTIFHEFGHALNISLSKSKYQYNSGARVPQDFVEIHSHFLELFLQDYEFVSKWAQHETVAEGKREWKPISLGIFKKLSFCD